MRVEASRPSAAVEWGLKLQVLATERVFTITITAVEDHSPFAGFGLQPGSLIVSVQGKPTRGMAPKDLREAMQVASRLALEVVAPGVDPPRESGVPSTRRVRAERGTPTAGWGLQLDMLSSDGRLGDVKLSSIDEDGLFGGQGLQPGMRVRQVQDKPVALMTVEGLQSVLRHSRRLTLDVEEAAGAPTPSTMPPTTPPPTDAPGSSTAEPGVSPSSSAIVPAKSTDRAPVIPFVPGLVPLELQPWYQPDCTRAQAATQLADLPDGTCLVRCDPHSNTLVLCFRLNGRLHERVVERRRTGFVVLEEQGRYRAVRAPAPIFPSLPALIAAHSASALAPLPCPLIPLTGKDQNRQVYVRSWVDKNVVRLHPTALRSRQVTVEITVVEAPRRSTSLLGPAAGSTARVPPRQHRPALTAPTAAAARLGPEGIRGVGLRPSSDSDNNCRRSEHPMSGKQERVRMALALKRKYSGRSVRRNPTYMSHRRPRPAHGPPTVENPLYYDGGAEAGQGSRTANSSVRYHFARPSADHGGPVYDYADETEGAAAAPGPISSPHVYDRAVHRAADAGVQRHTYDHARNVASASPHRYENQAAADAQAEDGEEDVEADPTYDFADNNNNDESLRSGPIYDIADAASPGADAATTTPPLVTAMPTYDLADQSPETPPPPAAADGDGVDRGAANARYTRTTIVLRNAQGKFGFRLGQQARARAASEAASGVGGAGVGATRDITVLEVKEDIHCIEGTLMKGDHLLSIDGHDLQGLALKQAYALLQECGNSVKVLVSNNKVYMPFNPDASKKRRHDEADAGLAPPTTARRPGSVGNRRQLAERRAAALPAPAADAADAAGDATEPESRSPKKLRLDDRAGARGEGQDPDRPSVLTTVALQELDASQLDSSLESEAGAPLRPKAAGPSGSVIVRRGPGRQSFGIGIRDHGEGVVVSSVKDSCEIVRGSLKQGDHIVAIAGEPVTDKVAAIARIRRIDSDVLELAVQPGPAALRQVPPRAPLPPPMPDDPVTLRPVGAPEAGNTGSPYRLISVRRWDPHLVEEWLREQGFDQELRDRFSSDGVDGPALLRLTRDNLRHVCSGADDGVRDRLADLIEELRTAEQQRAATGRHQLRQEMSSSPSSTAELQAKLDLRRRKALEAPLDDGGAAPSLGASTSGSPAPPAPASFLSPRQALAEDRDYDPVSYDGPDLRHVDSAASTPRRHADSVDQWETNDVLLYLVDHDLGSLRPYFTRAQVDGKVLMSLDDDDLVAMGIPAADIRSVSLVIRRLRNEAADSQKIKSSLERRSNDSLEASPIAAFQELDRQGVARPSPLQRGESATGSPMVGVAGTARAPFSSTVQPPVSLLHVDASGTDAESSENGNDDTYHDFNLSIHLHHETGEDKMVEIYLAELAEWVAETLDIDDLTQNNLLGRCRNGQLLLQLARELDPGARVQAKPGNNNKFYSLDNVTQFIRWARTHIGVPDTQLFEAEDLVDDHNTKQFLIGLMAVARLQDAVEPPNIVVLERSMSEGDVSTISETIDPELVLPYVQQACKEYGVPELAERRDENGRFYLGKETPVFVIRSKNQELLVWEDNHFSPLAEHLPSAV